MIGVTEIDSGTLYNTLLYLGPDGRLMQRHRKLMPTGGERTVWGMGDGSELGVVSTPAPLLDPSKLTEILRAPSGRPSAGR